MPSICFVHWLPNAHGFSVLLTLLPIRDAIDDMSLEKTGLKTTYLWDL